MATLLPEGKQSFETGAGIPLVGGKLYTYDAGTNNPRASYSDAAGAVPNTNPVILDARGEATVFWSGAYKVVLKDALDNTIWTVDNVQGAEVQMTADLSSFISPAKGAGMIGFAYALAYGANTVGKWLQDLALAAGSTFIGFLQAGTGAISRTLQSKLRDTVSVKDFGAVGDGVTNDYAAFAAAWAAIKGTGGTINIPPGIYLLNTQWLLDVDQTLPYNYSVIGYGAQLLAGAAVTGHALKVYKGYNNFGVKIEGLHFNHRNNTTVNGCIQGAGAGNLRVVKCSMEAHNTKATYAAIELGPYTAGDGNTNSFWALIDGFTTRQRAGGDGTLAAVGVRLTGVANATKIVNCSFGGVVDAIRFDTDGVAAGLANAVVILHNDFEGVTNAITINTAAPCNAMPTGLRIGFNRVESTTSFINVTGAAVTDSAYPPSAENNYCTVGSVTNYLVNPNNQFFFTNEPSYFGVGARNVVGGPADFKIIVDTIGKNVVIGNLSGSSNYAGGHLVIGAYHFWVESATGKFRMKSSAPTSDSDGTVVGTQT